MAIKQVEVRVRSATNRVEVGVGLPGIQGPPGDPGGPPGPDGKSAYEVAVDEGFVGDEAAWLASLEGDQGPPGADGSDGVVQSVVAGTGITVDSTDPANPVVSASGGGGSGDVVGVAPSVAGNFAAYTDTTGKEIEDSGSSAATFATAAQGALADSALQSTAIGVSIQAYDADLSAIGALAKTDGNVIVGDGSTWVAESGATARTSLGLGNVATLNTGTGSGNVPVLDGSGLLDTAVLPSIAITDVTVVASQAAMLALTAQKGDIAIRSDLNKSFALSTNSPSTLADWKELLTPTDAVLSVAGLTGAISASGLRTALTLVVGTDVQAYDADLAAVAALSATGMVARTAAGTAAVRTITGTTNQITVTDGNGVSGNPTLSLPTVAQPYGKQAIPVPAGAMKATTTNGAASGTVEMTTNKNMFVTLDFDTSTQEFAQFSIAMPKSWNESTVTFVPIWSHAATTTNFGVVWQLAGVAVSNDDAGDVAFGTAQTSTDTGGTTNDIYFGPESSAITIAGTPATNDLVMFQIARVPANGSDTMAIDARLHGITLFITTDAGNDA